jgi:GT2 family glycosyltransferase
MPEQVTISVIIVNWNSREDLRACLKSLEEQTSRDFETIVVDNGSTDGSLEMLGTEFPAVVLVDAGENLGFAEGCNRGIARATGTWIATLNNDAVASPTWIAELRRVAEGGGSNLGMLQSRILFKQDPTRTNSTGVLIRSDGFFVDRAYDRPASDDDTIEEIFCACAGAALYRRSMLEEVHLASGFFDRTFFMYFEDVDLGWRCRLAGWSAMYVPNAVVKHEFQGSSKMHRGRFIGLHLRRNRVRMLLKNGTWWFVVRTLPRTIYELCETIVWLGPRVIPSLVRAVGDGLRQRSEVTRLLRTKRSEVERNWLAPPS